MSMDVMMFVKLVNMSIAASWLILVVMLLRLILRKAPKWVNVLLWGLVALRLLCPFSIKSALSLIPGSETVPEEIFFYEAAQQHTPAWLDIADNPAFSQNVSLTTGQSASTVQTHFLLWTLLWLAGMTAMLLYAAISYARLRRRVSESIPLRENIYLCDRVQTPFILGVFRPKVYLPAALNEEQMQSVIAHERAHLARRDHWWKLLGWLLLTVYWFNPLCWAAHILFCRDIEMACDEKVIRDMDAAGRKNYSEALLSCSLPKRSVAACPLAFGEVGVKQRIKGVLNYKKPAFWLVALAVLVCAAAAVCFLTDPMEKTGGADAPYEYPVRPGMDAWAQYQSLEEQIEACQVPEELLSAMTTEALVETVADYPLLVNILAYSNPGDGDAGIIRGAGDVMGYCNALKELSRRPDVLPAVQAKQAELEQDESPEAAVKATCFRAIAGLFKQFEFDGSAQTENGWSKDFEITEKGTLNAYHGTAAEVLIPDRVRKIGIGAFSGNDNLKKVVLPEGLTAICAVAFRDCPNLTEVVLPETLTEIEGGAFMYCRALTKIKLPEGLRRIDGNAFYDCKELTLDSLPSTLKSIGEAAFYGCSSLTEIKIPEGVTELPDLAFAICGALKTVEIPATVTYIHPSAFAGSDAVIIHCAAESAAEAFAKEADIPIVYIN